MCVKQEEEKNAVDDDLFTLLMIQLRRERRLPFNASILMTVRASRTCPSVVLHFSSFSSFPHDDTIEFGSPHRRGNASFVCVCVCFFFLSVCSKSKSSGGGRSIPSPKQNLVYMFIKNMPFSRPFSIQGKRFWRVTCNHRHPTSKKSGYSLL